MATTHTTGMPRAAVQTVALIFGVGFLAAAVAGFVATGGNDPWLHLVLGVPLLVAGMMAKSSPATTAHID